MRVKADLLTTFGNIVYLVTEETSFLIITAGEILTVVYANILQYI